jgi:tetratricopeptide (TPR) repeat protein
MKLPSLFLLLALTAATAHEHHDHKTPAPEKKVPTDPELDRLKLLANLKAAGPRTWVRLGDALMQRARDRVSHDFTEAAAAYQKALALDPEDIGAIVGMAWVKNSEHNFPAGREWAEKALAANPHQVEAHALIADGEIEMGNYEQAYEHCRAALQVRSDLSTLSRMGHLMWITGRATQGRAMMRQAIDAGGPYPENAAWCRAELALMNFQSGAMRPAEQLVTQALEAAPENPRVLAIAGRIFTANQDYPKATGLYEKSAAITPNHEALAGLVDLYQLAGETEKAGRQFERVLAYHKAHSHGGHVHSHGEGNAQLARFLADHDREPELALKEARTAYLTYKNVGTADTLAWCLLKAGKPEEAREMIRRAMKWKTPDAEIHFHAGMIELALKQPETARKCFHRALSLNPNFHPIRAKLAAELMAK